MVSHTCKLALISLSLIFGATLSFGQSTKPGRQKSGEPGSEKIYFNSDAREVIQPSGLTADKVSATSIGDVLTVLFDGAKISLQNESDPLNATWVGAIRVPVRKAAKTYTSYLQHLRGAVMKSENSRVSLMLDLGGKAFTVEYPYGMKSNGDIMRKFVSLIRPRPAESYTATILVTVERRDPKSAVLVSVDSLDVEARLLKSHKK